MTPGDAWGMLYPILIIAYTDCSIVIILFRSLWYSKPCILMCN